MPQAIAAYAVAAAINAGVTSLVVAQIIYGITYAVVAVGISAVTSKLSSLLVKKPKSPSASSFTQSLQERTITARQPIAPRRIVYGNIRVGGVYTFIHTTGSSNEYLNTVITLTGHQIEAIDAIYFDGEEVPFVFAEEWAAEDYPEGDVVASNDTYYTRTATAYPLQDVVVDSPPSAPALWTLTTFDNSVLNWVAQSYATGEKTNVATEISGGETDTYIRTATAYPTENNVSQEPSTEPTLWTETPDYESTSVTITGDYAGFVYAEFNLGTDDQMAFPGLVEEAPDKWTENHRQRGCASVYLKLKYSSDKFPNGLPTITFLIRGKNDIYDPRTDTNGYTNNAALCVADYIALPKIGLEAEYTTEILIDDLIEAANICEEQVELIEGGFENRYEANGSIDTDATPYENLTSLVGSMAGVAVTQGKLWTIRAGAYRAPEIAALTDGDFVGGIDLQTLTSRVESFNGVKGVFTSPNNSWQPDDFPAVSVSQYVADDGGEEVWSEITLPMTTSVSAAQRIARLMLELQRRQISVTVPVKTIAYQLQPYDTVELTIDRYGWDAKTFQVKNLELIIDKAWSVRLDLQEIDAAAFAWSTTDESVYNAAPTTNLPSAFEVSSPGITVTDTIVPTPTGGAATNLVVTIQPPNDVFVDRFETEFKTSTDSEWSAMPSGPSLIVSTANVEDGLTYDVRSRSVNNAGVRSSFSDIKQRTVIGQTALPPDVTNFAINIIDGSADLAWSPVNVVDLSHYRIKFAPTLTGATWASSTLLVDKVGKPATSITVPALVGTYLIKAVDFGERESENPTLVVSNVQALRTFNAVEELIEDPTFLGVKDNTIVTGSDLRLAYGDDVFARTDFFEVSDFFFGTSGYVSEGFYYFDDTIELGTVYTSRVTANVVATGENGSVDVFTRPDFFGVDDFFGATPSQWGAVLQIRTTDDDSSSSPVTWSEWSPFVTGDYSARDIQFRIRLTSNEFGVTPIVSELSVRVDMPDETRADNDLVVTTGGLGVTFNPSFRSLKGVGISSQGLQTGDYYNITSKSENGFTIQFFDSADIPVQRTMDYVAVGYGRVS